jgi:hypothetical protein
MRRWPVGADIDTHGIDEYSDEIVTDTECLHQGVSKKITMTKHHSYATLRAGTFRAPQSPTE